MIAMESAEGRLINPRLSNLICADAGASLPLPRIPVVPLDDEPKPREPKLLDRLLERLGEVLEQTDVSYLSSTLQLAAGPPRGSTLRNALISKYPDVFKVTANRPSRKANPPRQALSTIDAVAAQDATQSAERTAAPQVAQPLRAGITRAVELLRGPSREELIGNFNHTIQDILEKHDEAVSCSLGKVSMKRNELSDLGRKVKQMVDEKLLCKIDPDDIVRLLDVLASQMENAEGVNIDEGDNEKSANAQDIMRALDAVCTSLQILGGDDMPKKVYREESIDKMVAFIEYHMVHNVFVFVSAEHYTIHRGLREENGDGEDDSHKTPVQSSKRRKSAASSSKRNSIGTATPRRAVMPRVVKTINDMISGALTLLANLLFITGLPDATVLQITNLGISTLLVDDLDLIQAKAVEMVVAAFKQYPEHRSLIIDHMIGTLRKLPSSGRNLRRYMLPDDDSVSIQSFTGMLMKCIQASVTFEDFSVASDVACEKPGEHSDTIGYGSALRWSHYFWKELIKGWHSAKVLEIDIKGLMQNLVSDMLITLNIPEWPVASLMLLSLCQKLLSSDGVYSSEHLFRVYALDFLGQVTARVKGDMLACENETLWSSLSRNLVVADDASVTPQVILAAEAAHRDAANSRNRVHPSSTSEALQVVDDERVDMLVLETMLLRYISRTTMRIRVPGHEEPSALTFCLAQLTREAERKGVGFRSGRSGPGGDRITYKELRDTIRNQEYGFGSTLIDGIALPRDFAIRLCRLLQQQLPLARQLNILVRRLCGALEDSAIRVRVAAVRAIGSVVEADPQVLGLDEVRPAVERRMTDNGAQVRSAVIGLLGKQMMHNADLAGKYYDAIVDRISDVNVSVRTSVIHILHGCLCSSSTFSNTNGALRSLAFRVLDDDVGIQKLVVSIFRDLWFSPLPTNDSVDEVKDSIKERAEQLVEVLWEVYCGVSRTGLAKLPLLPTFPIVAILRRIIFPSNDDTPALASDNRETRDMVMMARQMCNVILNGLLLQEDEIADLTVSDCGHSGGISSFPRTVRYALGLHVFCATDPQLCVSDENPMAYATALHPYIKRCGNNSANSMQLQCCISVIDAVFQESGAIAPHVAIEMEKDLRFLLLRNTYHGVLYYASRCICTIAETGINPAIAPGALQICRRFVKLLDEMSAKEQLSTGDHAHVSRALFVLGHLARFGADILEASKEESVSPAAMLRIFREFLQRNVDGEFDLKRSALGACGHLFVSRPNLMLSTKGGFGKGSMDGLMRSALHPSTERGLKEQALLNLDEYLREEEARTLTQMSDDHALGNQANVDDQPSSTVVGTGGAVSRAKRQRAKADKQFRHGDGKAECFQTVNGEHDNSLANGVAQRYWPDIIQLCTDPDAPVRLKALHLAEVVLRQGLVHPMTCFPPLIALQIDPVAHVRKLALRLLIQQHGKYPDFFDNQLSAGLELLYKFCKKLELLAKRATKQRKRKRDETLPVPRFASDADVDIGFSQIYKLNNNTRTARFKFLHALLRRYESNVTNTKISSSDTRVTGSENIDYMCFLARAISALPFSMNDEALFVVFHLNRIISLRASTLQDSLRRLLDPLRDSLPDDKPEANLKDSVLMSLTASIMLTLKRHMKETYELADARTQAYNPSEPFRPGETLKRDEQASELDLSWVDPSSGATIGGCRRQVDLFCKLMKEDTNDYADQIRVGKVRRGRPSSDAAPPTEADTAAVDTDHEHENGNDVMPTTGPSTGGPRTVALPSTGIQSRWGKVRARDNDDMQPTPRKRLAL